MLGMSFFKIQVYQIRVYRDQPTRCLMIHGELRHHVVQLEDVILDLTESGVGERRRRDRNDCRPSFLFGVTVENEDGRLLGVRALLTVTPVMALMLMVVCTSFRSPLRSPVRYV